MSDNAAKTGDESTPEMDVEAVQGGGGRDVAPSRIGTIPGHEVARALRAMMGEVPDEELSADALHESRREPQGDVELARRVDSVSIVLSQTRPDRDSSPSLEEGVTQTELPQEVADALRARDDRALPAFALDDDEHGSPAPPLSPTKTKLNPVHGDREGSTRALPYTPRATGAQVRGRGSETHPVYQGPLPSLTRPYEFGELASGEDKDLEPLESSSSIPHLGFESISTDVYRQNPATEKIDAISSFAARMARTADAPALDESTRATRRSDDDDAPAVRHDTMEGSALSAELGRPSAGEDLPRFSLASLPDAESQLDATTAPAGWPALSPNVADLGAAVDWAPSERDVVDDPDARPEAQGSGVASDDSVERPDPPRDSMESIEVRISSPFLDTAEFAAEVRGDTAGAAAAAETVPAVEEIDLEVMSGELVDDDTAAAELPKPSTYYPPASPQVEPPAFAQNPDDEERALLEEHRYEPLVALYQQRLEAAKTPNRRAAVLLKIASVYETGLQDINQAFQTLIEAFEVAPSNEDVVTAVDRVGKEAGRIGELAERVKSTLLPSAPDDKRVAYLGHLVYWYERVLGRGADVSPFVSDIERHDRVHPLVLKRAAQIAAMNDDTKTQRAHLLRALERTIRREEKVTLHLALSSAYAGTPDALKHYQLALEIDPTSIVALQGVKRLGKEKEQYAQVQWALERQAEVALTESERVDALLELAELQERKFLKRELAAELFERVVELEPSQPAALQGLERCYHALRDWSKLARVLERRSTHTFDNDQKVELLSLAAEVHESKRNDFAKAAEIYTNILSVDPKHRRAATDLARLHEKLGDWAKVATYKAQLAELAPTKRASSQELVKLGDLLSAPDRDPLTAKLQYERAVDVDPSNAAAWEALQRIAASSGDVRRVIECLEMRKEHTEAPRQRALVAVELANVHREAGNEAAAQECFEVAILADASNEAAAIAMLDHYTASERWSEAAPLCELLVNAAIRDRDGEALFIRLRLATRIAAALGDADRATTSALAALDARPTDPGAKADLIAVCAQSPASTKRALAQLTQMADEADVLAIDGVVRLGAILRDAGDLDRAAAMFERARRTAPESRDITKDLSDVYLRQGDFPRSCKLKMDLARSSLTGGERFDLLVETGEIWARRADELEKAATIFEEAREIKPRDPWLLQTLMWLYGELGEWSTLSQVLEEIVQIHEKPLDKLKTLVAMAEVVRDKLGDRLRAADLFDEALDIDKKRLDIFEELVRTLTEERNWEKLERSYRRMIARVKDDEAESQLQFLLFQQLGLIYRDRLGDASRAYDSLDAAARLRPDDAELRRIVVELLVVTDNLDNAVARLRDAIDRDPHEPQLYAELYEVFLRQRSFDKAWCTVNVLSRLREPSSEQRRFHEDYAPMGLDRVPGQIVEQAWQSHVFHADLEEALTNLFAMMTPAVARLRFGQLRPEQRVGRPFTPTHSRMHDAIRKGFDNAAEILALTAPELLLGDPKSPFAFTPALAPFGSISVAVPQVEAQSSSLIYLVGKRLAEQRPELAARAFFPSVPDLTSLLGTAVRVSRNETAKDSIGTALDASFSAILTSEEREGLRTLVLRATDDGAALDVKRWSHAADLSSMRAGLLLCGDVEPARASIQTDGQATSDLSVRDKVGELYKFATSDLYSDLRGAIGVAVQG